MKMTNLAREIGSLPPEAQQQIMDFLAFLKSRYLLKSPTSPAKRTKLADEPFIGMWRDREDMQDSTSWVRQVRRHEWGNPV